MACYKSSSLPVGITSEGRASYATEADCLNACKEGACCEGTTCSVKPQCQCQGTGKTFKGVGTTCESTKGACCTGTSCAVVSECECVGTGKTFNGVGTTCSPNPCIPCVEYCQPSGNTPPQTIYFTISNYTAASQFLSLGSLNGTYALARASDECLAYGTLLFPTDCLDVGQPNFCITPCTHKLSIGVNDTRVSVFAFDRTSQGANCRGFYLFQLNAGFNSCTQTSKGGSSASGMSSNAVGASFDYSITVANPLP